MTRLVQTSPRSFSRSGGRVAPGQGISRTPAAAKSFLEWLITPEAQKIYASKGYRSVLPDLVDKSTYPDPQKLFKIDEFGGWSKVNDEFFDPEKGSVAAIEKDLGVNTAG